MNGCTRMTHHDFSERPVSEHFVHVIGLLLDEARRLGQKRFRERFHHLGPPRVAPRQYTLPTRYRVGAKIV